MAKALYAQTGQPFLCAQGGYLIAGTDTAEPDCVCGGGGNASPCCGTGATCTPTAPLVPANPDTGEPAYTKILIRLAGSISFTVTTNDSGAIPTTVNWTPPAELEARASGTSSCVLYVVSPFFQDTQQVDAGHRWARFAQVSIVFYMAPGTFGDPTHCGITFQLSAGYQQRLGSGAYQTNETASFLSNGGCPNGCGDARWRLLDNVLGRVNEGCISSAGGGGGELATVTGSMVQSSSGQCSSAASSVVASVNTGVQTIAGTSTTMSLVASVNLSATLAPGTVAACPPALVSDGHTYPPGWVLNSDGVPIPPSHNCNGCGQ